MPEFVQHRMHEKCIDASYLPLLRRLDRFVHQVAICRRRRAGGAHVDTDSLVEYHDSIHHHALDRAGNGPPVPEAEAIEAFACGVLRALHYRDTVLSGLPVLDLAGSQTLEDFSVDFDEGSERAAREALQQAFGLDDERLRVIQRDLTDELEALSARRAIMEALAELHPLDGDPDTDCHALFTALFPSHPLRPGEVRLIRTGTSLFLTVPFKDGELVTPVGTRDTQEQRALEAFLQRLAEFEQPYLANFPVFGCYRADASDPALLEALIAATGLPRQRLVRKLTTMVTVLPTPELDQYIVHDAWGHQWQALLYDFESRYQDAARYRRPPPPNAGYGADHINLLQAAREFDETGSLETYDRYLQAAFAHRLTTTLSGLFAEVLADAVEYKYLVLNPDKRAMMPSSSFFKELAAKLDLTLHDLPQYFSMAQHGFERLAFSDSERERLADALRAEGIEEPARIAAALGERLASWLDEVHRADLQYEVAEEGVYINVFARVALHFAQLHAILNDLYERLAKHELSGPMQHFGDVLVFATASYYERQPAKNFWTTDDFLEQWFEPLFERFVRALDERSP